MMASVSIVTPRGEIGQSLHCDTREVTDEWVMALDYAILTYIDDLVSFKYLRADDTNFSGLCKYHS